MEEATLNTQLQDHGQNQWQSGPSVPGPNTRPAVVGTPEKTATYSYRGVSVAWLIGGIVAAIIAIRFVLELLGASTAAAFAALVYAITAPLVAPFQGIFPTPARHGYLFDGAALLAIVIYLLATWGVVALVRIMSTSRGARTPVD
jgi:uncharacterized protein YggT (Ycf19 family)